MKGVRSHPGTHKMLAWKKTVTQKARQLGGPKKELPLVFYSRLTSLLLLKSLELILTLEHLSFFKKVSWGMGGVMCINVPPPCVCGCEHKCSCYSACIGQKTTYRTWFFLLFHPRSPEDGAQTFRLKGRQAPQLGGWAILLVLPSLSVFVYIYRWSNAMNNLIWDYSSPGGWDNCFFFNQDLGSSFTV